MFSSGTYFAASSMRRFRLSLLSSVPDLVVTSTAGDAAWILLGTGKGAFSSTEFGFATGTDPLWVAVGDFNGDHKPDLAVANSGSNNITVLINTTR